MTLDVARIAPQTAGAVEFLAPRRNRMLIRADGRPRLADNAMKCLRIVPFNRINLGGTSRLENGV